MENKILQSVIEITRHRDLDSLEYSLVATLAEIVPARQIAIYKTYSTGSNNGIEEVLRMSISDHDPSNVHYVWSERTITVDSDAQLEQCIESETVATHKTDDKLNRVLIPISNDGGGIGAICIRGTDEIKSSIALAQNLIKIYENYQIILNESEHDKLTGLFNRRTFDKKLGRLLKIQSDRNRQYSASDISEKRHPATGEYHAWLVVLDFDNFKQINDTYGHSYGDEVLLILSQKMKQCFRKTDLLFRFGGDEFVIILEPVTLDHATAALENFRNAVASHDFPQVGKITISTGFAQICSKDYPPAILEKADKALYYAKDNGRNCTFNYEALVALGKLKDKTKSGAIDLF